MAGPAVLVVLTRDREIFYSNFINFILGFSRYASAIERNPEDYDALYNWALVLQV